MEGWKSVPQDGQRQGPLLLVHFYFARGRGKVLSLEDPGNQFNITKAASEDPSPHLGTGPLPVLSSADLTLPCEHPGIRTLEASAWRKGQFPLSNQFTGKVSLNL